MLRTVLLTTEATHHRFFAWKVHERFPWSGILLETGQATPSFEVFHLFEAQRDAYERDVLLAGSLQTFQAMAPCRVFESANDPASVQWLKVLAPEVIIVFGTRRLVPNVFRVPSRACLNLHGGDPERYRGLDSQLWAISRGEFGALTTTLHHVDEGLDTGDIVGQAPLVFHRGHRLHHLRAVNTIACVELTLQALSRLHRGEPLPARRPAERGAYYSWMPSALKAACVEQFERFIEGRAPDAHPPTSGAEGAGRRAKKRSGRRALHV